MGAFDDILQVKRHRLAADAYQQMGAAGIFPPDARVELIEGEVIEMAPIGTRHWAAVNRLLRLFERAVGDRGVVSIQSSFRLGDYSEPEPDVGLFKPRDDFYATALPTAADTLLIVEVADSSARYDREVKLPLYARHGIGEVWIVDLGAGLLRTYQQPQGDGYLRAIATPEPGVTAIEALPGIAVDLTGLLG